MMVVHAAQMITSFGGDLKPFAQLLSRESTALLEKGTPSFVLVKVECSQSPVFRCERRDRKREIREELRTTAWLG